MRFPDKSQDDFCVLVMARVDALPKGAIRPRAKLDGIILDSEVDPVTDNELIWWSEDAVIDGQVIPFGLGSAITRESREDDFYPQHRVAVVTGLRDAVWTMKEHIRLGCYRLLPPARSMEQEPI